ncbi:hypothetical protein HYDPIDRAFT_25332 [Hydnomerulius pinastri MD-312]|nr:hypothetical protein HYDPIDRAFT_25332 [Hydnomerulius pinastri MD-312]
MSLPLSSWLTQNYRQVKTQHSGEGRRRWRLRVARQFWTSLQSNGTTTVLPDVTTEAIAGADFITDSDPLDEASSQRPELGLAVRTDFSNEDAWLAFCARLEEGEKEFVETGEQDMQDDGPVEQTPANATGEQDDSDDSDDEDAPPPIFHIINPPSPQDRHLLTDISNLTALRLFNDVDVRTAPSPPKGSKRVKPANRLVDCHGWQEIYTGKNIWIYDTKSNTDQCARLVSQSGDMYGTATGDSWRARVSHICELQVNLFSGAMKIDFGGLDRWDYNERQRNMKEAEQE